MPAMGAVRPSATILCTNDRRDMLPALTWEIRFRSSCSFIESAPLMMPASRFLRGRLEQREIGSTLAFYVKGESGQLWTNRQNRRLAPQRTSTEPCQLLRDDQRQLQRGRVAFAPKQAHKRRPAVRHLPAMIVIGARDRQADATAGRKAPRHRQQRQADALDLVRNQRRGITARKAAKRPSRAIALGRRPLASVQRAKLRTARSFRETCTLHSRFEPSGVVRIREADVLQPSLCGEARRVLKNLLNQGPGLFCPAEPAEAC